MNCFNFTGALGKDCEKRYTQSGKAVASFSVAVNSGFGDNRVTTWVNCSVWDKQAESLEQYLIKGASVGISGELTLRQYENKDGSKGSSLDVRVISLTLLGGKSDSNAPKQNNNAANSSKHTPNDGGFYEDESPAPF